jgi:phosphoenolpyruvate-protein kinase (PTS system EI component)
MGMMWLWERRTSRQREQQIDEAHARIMADRVMLDQLMSLVRQNSEALTALSSTQQQFIEQLRTRGNP